MGQETVLKLVEQLQFTTFNELRYLVEKYDMGNQALTKALSKLNSNNELITFKISRETIYLSPEFYEEIGIIQ